MTSGTFTMTGVDLAALRLKLLPEAERLHRKILARFPDLDLEAEDLLQEALARLLEHAEGGGAAIDNVEGWLYRVMERLALGRWKRESRRRWGGGGSEEGGGEVSARPTRSVGSQELEDQPAPQRAPGEEATLAEGRAQLRAALDEVRWEDTGEVGLYAVLLLLVRAHAWRQMQRVDRREGYAWTPDELRVMVEELLPWHPDEEALVLREGWPPLREVWPRLRDVLVGSPGKLRARDVTAALNAGLAAPLHLRPNTWQQWNTRARDRAERELGEARWRATFGRWGLLRQRDDDDA